MNNEETKQTETPKEEPKKTQSTVEEKEQRKVLFKKYGIDYPIS